MKVKKVLALTDNDSQVQELASAAVELGEEVVLVYGGEKDICLQEPV